MLTAIALILLVVAASPAAQEGAGFTGTWRAADRTMGEGGDSVESPMGLTGPRSMRPPITRELTIAEPPDGIEVSRPDTGGRQWTLPESGATITTTDGRGAPIQARAIRDGSALVIRTEQRVMLPGGGEVLVETEERYVLLSAGTLQVTVVSKASGRSSTRQWTYERVN